MVLVEMGQHQRKLCRTAKGADIIPDGVKIHRMVDAAQVHQQMLRLAQKQKTITKFHIVHAKSHGCPSFFADLV